MFYPDHTRYAQLAAVELGLDFVDLDEGNGYLFSVRGNGKNLLSGAGNICSYPVNSAPSYTISRDKAHTKRALAQSGVATIEGQHFFLTSSHAALRNPGHEYHDAFKYAASLGFPVFCKPLAGSRGDFAEIVSTITQLREYLGRVVKRYDAILIERLMRGDEYRVLIFDRAPVYYVAKSQPTLQPDGRSSLRSLLLQLNKELEGTGVSAYPLSCLAESGYEIDDVPPAGRDVKLAGRRNLSALGGVDLFDTIVPAELSRIATESCDALGLRLGAVDIFDASAVSDLSQLIVIEVNGNPMLRAVEEAGRLDLIISVWKRMLRESLGI
jgi:glutathione synthase/RimK-type ligase-like ATP-grasp enzyme